MSMNLVVFLYLIASVCFIQALKGLSHPTTSIRGNLFGMLGMAIAILTTAGLIITLAESPLGLGWVLLGLLIGGTIGTDRKSTRLNSSHVKISYAVFCLKKKKPPQRV